MKRYALFAILCSVLASGCALKAPLVTDTLPITRIQGVPAPAAKQAGSAAAPTAPSRPQPTSTSRPQPAPTADPTPATAPLLPSLDADSDEVSLKTLSGTHTYYLAGNQSLPPLAKALQIDTMTFRSLLTDASDQTPDALKNDGLTDPCAAGRANLDFIQSVAVGVRHKAEPDSAAVLVASYTQAKTGLCGFHLTPTEFDMKDYAGDYVFVIQVTGVQPPATVSISGFYTVQDYEGL